MSDKMKFIATMDWAIDVDTKLLKKVSVYSGEFSFVINQYLTCLWSKLILVMETTTNTIIYDIIYAVICTKNYSAFKFVSVVSMF